MITDCLSFIFYSSICCSLIVSRSIPAKHWNTQRAAGVCVGFFFISENYSSCAFNCSRRVCSDTEYTIKQFDRVNSRAYIRSGFLRSNVDVKKSGLLRNLKPFSTPCLDFYVLSMLSMLSEPSISLSARVVCRLPWPFQWHIWRIADLIIPANGLLIFTGSTLALVNWHFKYGGFNCQRGLFFLPSLNSCKGISVASKRLLTQFFEGLVTPFFLLHRTRIRV
jgi:hypothetical protein